VVRNHDLRQKMVAACGDQGMVGEAAVNLVVCGVNDRPMLCGQGINAIDCSIAAAFMMLKATELGLGTCWLGRFSAGLVREILGIPAADTVVAVLPLGYAAEAPDARGRKALKEFVRMLD
jgi:nitroreductase